MYRTGEVLHRRPHSLLDRMVRFDIAFRRQATMNRKAQKAGMLAGAIIMLRARRPPLLNEDIAGWSVGGPLRTAFQVGSAQPSCAQHSNRAIHMPGLAIVGGLGKGDLAIRKTKRIGSAGFNQRQGLYRLDGRAGINRCIDVSGRKDHGTATIANGNGTAMAAFHHRPARDFNQNRICHKLTSFDRTIRCRVA